MPDPSVIKFSDVNTELAQSASQIITTSNNHVRNVAAAGLSGEYGFSDLRWGINFPGRRVVASTTSGFNEIRYRTNSLIVVDAEYILAGAARAANATIRINNSGTIQYQAVGGVTNTFTRTWLTSGVNSDYTANLHLSTGAITSGNTTSVDHPLSGNLSWTVRSVALTSGSIDEDSASGALIIKSGGVEIFRRSFLLDTYAERL